VPVVVIPGDPVTLRFDSTRTESQVGRLLTEDALQRVAGRQDPLTLREERVTEPGARYIDFLIPGLLGMNIMGTGVWGVGFGIAQTRQRKLLKRLLASPMRKRDFLIGQMMARMVFLVVEVSVVVLFGILAFDVPFRGSVLSVALLVLVGAFTFAGLGALIASRVQTLEGVSGLMNVVLMPMWVLSGVFFSYSRFPEVMHPFIQVLPLTALNDSLRAVMLDGASLSSTFVPLVVMSIWCVACVSIALKIFRWS
jgi:ABC-type multidrug transport system permease subunit